MSLDVTARFEGVKRTGNGTWRAVCPSCGGKAGKLSLKERDDGGWLLHCFSGCAAQEVCAAVGLNLADLFPVRPAGEFSRGERKPRAARDVIQALRGEVLIAWILLADLSAGIVPSDDDRERARIALNRIENFMDELSNAH